jgi:hypothetical protein
LENLSGLTEQNKKKNPLCLDPEEQELLTHLDGFALRV